MLDPASSVEMVKVLEEDPMVGGVGGDVQVSTTIFRLTEESQQPFSLKEISLPGTCCGTIIEAFMNDVLTLSLC